MHIYITNTSTRGLQHPRFTRRHHSTIPLMHKWSQRMLRRKDLNCQILKDPPRNRIARVSSAIRISLFIATRSICWGKVESNSNLRNIHLKLHPLHRFIAAFNTNFLPLDCGVLRRTTLPEIPSEWTPHHPFSNPKSLLPPTSRKRHVCERRWYLKILLALSEPVGPKTIDLTSLPRRNE